MEERVDRRERVERSLVEWAEGEDSVRAVVLVGSRAEPGAPVDALSDFDVLLFAREGSRVRTSDLREPEMFWD